MTSLSSIFENGVVSVILLLFFQLKKKFKRQLILYVEIYLFENKHICVHIHTLCGSIEPIQEWRM